MPVSKSKSNNKDCSIIIRRDGEEFVMKVKFSDESDAEKIHAMSVHHRAMSDAIDILLFLRKYVKDKEDKEDDEYYAELDMKAFRKISMTKGNAVEEAIMGVLLHNLLVAQEWKILNLGFPANEKGEFINNDKFYVEFKTK